MMIESFCLQYLHRNRRASLGIGQGVVMVLQVVAAAGSDDVEIVMAARPDFARSDAGAIELIIGIIHLINAEDGFQTVLVEGFVMSHKRQAALAVHAVDAFDAVLLEQGFHLFPHEREDGRILGVFGAKPMHLSTPVVVIFWLGLDEGIKSIDNLSVANDDDTNRTNG